MPTARTDQQHRNIFLQLVTLSFRAGKTDRPPDRIPQIDLALNHIRPRRRIRVFEIGHENLCAGIERIDHHLAIGRPGNLDPPIAQIRWNRCAGPVALTDRFCFRQKIECFATIESHLSILPALQTFFPAIAESALQPLAEFSMLRAPASSSPLLRPAWHLLQQPRLDECCDSRCLTWITRSFVAATHRSARAYLIQIPCPS